MMPRITILAIVALITSCDKFTAIETTATAIDEQAAAAIASHRPPPPQSQLLTTQVNSTYLGSRRPVQAISIPPPPPALQNQVDFAFVEPVELTRLAQILSDHAGIPIETDPELASVRLEGVEWSGTTSDALDSLTARLGVFWRIRDQHVLIYQTELSTWTIYAPTTIASWQATVGLSGSATATGGGSDLQANDQVQMKLDTADFWTQLESTVATLLSPKGRATLNSQTAELTVIDTPPALQRIDEWVRQKNREFASQVVIHVELYEIARSADAVKKINLEGLFQEAVGNKAFKIDFGAGGTGDAVGLGYSRSDNSATDEAEINLLLQLTAGSDQISKLTSTFLRTTNGQPVPVFFGDETGYLHRRDIITNDDNRTEVRLVPGTLQDGIGLNIVPRILPDTDRLMLNITLRTSRLKKIARFPDNAGPGDPVIQLPDLEKRSILLPVQLRSGETLFVAGLDTSRSTGVDSVGLLKKDDRQSTHKTSLVVLITPRIITPPAVLSYRRNLRS